MTDDRSDPSDAGLAAIANDHWLEAYRSLIADVNGEWRSFGAVHAFLGGLPLGFANGCLVLEPALPRDLEDAIEWVARAGVPYRVRMDERRARELFDVPLRMGLERVPEPLPGMVLRPIPDVPPPASGVSVIRVDEATYPEFEQLLIDTGLPARWARQAFPPTLVANRDAALIVGRLDGRPAGTSLAIRTGDVAGIYAVGTVEPARRRGVGTAATWAAVAVAREWRASAVVLQASAMGFPVYRSMGFVPVVDYARFGPPAPQVTQ